MNLAGTYCEYLAESCRQVDSVISAKTQEELEPSPWEEVHLQGEILETNLAHADFAWTYYSHVAEKRLVGKDVLNTVSICLSAQERKKVENNIGNKWAAGLRRALTGPWRNMRKEEKSGKVMVSPATPELSEARAVSGMFY